MSSTHTSSPSAEEDRKSLHDGDTAPHLGKYDSSIGEIKQQAGVSRMEAIARVVTARENRGILIGLVLALYACNFVVGHSHRRVFCMALIFELIRTPWKAVQPISMPSGRPPTSSSIAAVSPL